MRRSTDSKRASKPRYGRSGCLSPEPKPTPRGLRRRRNRDRACSPEFERKSRRSATKRWGFTNPKRVPPEKVPPRRSRRSPPPVFLWRSESRETNATRRKKKKKKTVRADLWKEPKTIVHQPGSAKRAPRARVASESEVRDFIARSYAEDTKEDVSVSGKKKTDDASVSGSGSVSVSGSESPKRNEPHAVPPKPPQIVTVSDLNASDREMIARAVGVVSNVELARSTFAVGAASLLAACLLARAFRNREPPPSPADEEIELDIDSAFGTPTRGWGTRERPGDRTPDLKGKDPSVSPGDDRNGPFANGIFAGGASPATPAAAAATHAETSSSPAPGRFSGSTRVRRAGELRVDVLETTTTTRALGIGAAVERAEAFTIRIAVDADADGATSKIRGSTKRANPMRFDGGDSKHARVFAFNSRVSFALPASEDDRAGKKVEARLCDGSGKTVAKTAVPLAAALRAAPVVKTFPLYDRDGTVVGTARVALEWECHRRRNDAAAAAHALLRRTPKA